MMLELLASPFKPIFQDFIQSLETDCLLCSPYITRGPVNDLVREAANKGVQETIRVKVLTDISTVNIVQGATDLGALLYLSEHIRNVEITYLPRIHAKVYISGNVLAIVGSANFTEGGSAKNLEYGVRIRDQASIAAIRDDIRQYASLGAIVSFGRLVELQGRVQQLRNAIQDEQKVIRQKLRTLSGELAHATEDELVRIRVHNRSVNGIFSDTILFLLTRSNMTTIQLNECIQQIHSDLCDDTTDRIIDGKHYGKLWKHQVRSAQVSLRRRGSIDYDRGKQLWYKK